MKKKLIEVALPLDAIISEAIDHVREAIALLPESANYHDELGNLLGGSGRFTEAAAAVREATRLDSSNANLWHNLGVQEHNAGRYAEAIEAYRRVARLDTQRAQRIDYRLIGEPTASPMSLQGEAGSSRLTRSRPLWI